MSIGMRLQRFIDRLRDSKILTEVRMKKGNLLHPNLLNPRSLMFPKSLLDQIKRSLKL